MSLPRFAVWRMPRAVAVPVLSSVDFDLFDVAGGESITITGTGLGSATLCTVGGTSCTITANTPTSLTFTTPAKTAGSYNLQVTTAGGASNTLSLEAWSPNQITGIDGYFDSRKGVTVDGSNRVTTWTEQSRSAAYTSPAANGDKPVLTFLFSFLSGTVAALRFDPSGSTFGAQSIGTAGGKRTLASGMSAFWVSKHSSTDTTVSDPGGANAPLTVVGDLSGGSYNNRGFSAGVLRSAHHTASWQSTDRGSGLNDSVARLHGWTHATGGDLKAYVGTTQQGATLSGQTYNTTFYGWSTIGGGYKDSTNAWDGFDGWLGAVVIVDGVISAGDLTKLHKWSRIGFGAAA